MARIYNKSGDVLDVVETIRTLAKPGEDGVLVTDVVRCVAVSGVKPATVRYWLRAYDGQGWKLPVVESHCMLHTKNSRYRSCLTKAAPTDSSGLDRTSKRLRKPGADMRPKNAQIHYPTAAARVLVRCLVVQPAPHGDRVFALYRHCA